MLYFKVVLEGISNLPAANPEIRKSIQQQADRNGWSSLHAELKKVDPKSAERLHPNHSQRIQRALEVYRITGVALSELQRQSEGGVEDIYDVQQYALIPQNRALLHQRIEQRFTAMMQAGFEEEVSKLYHRGDLHSDMPSIRAVGYSQLWSYLEGQVSLDEAVEKAIIATRQMSKRQQTWLRSWPNCQQISVDDGTRYYSTQELCDFILKLQ